MEEHFGKKPEVLFSEALLKYAKVHKRDHSKHFMEKTRYRLKMLSEWFGEFNLSEITLAVVQEYMDERLANVSLATVQKDVSTLRAILNKAYREDFLDKAPKFPKFKTLKPRDRWLTSEEEERLVRSASSHLVPLIIFAVETGGRLSELLGLDWHNVDLPNKRVIFRKTKNDEDRTVRLSDRACAVLAGFVSMEDGPVFTYKGRAIKRVKTSFDNARKKAGLDDVRFHDLRHTFVSRLVQGGVQLYDVMHLTGHKSLDMVQRYAHLAPNYQDGAIRVLNDRWHNLGTVDLSCVDGERLSA